MEFKTHLPAGTPILGVDLGNGYAKVSFLSNWTEDPAYLLPDALRSGMPSTAYVSPDGTIRVYGADRKGAQVSAVKTHLGERVIPLEYKGTAFQVTPDAVYAAIARDLVILANDQLRQRGKEPIYNLLLTYPASFRFKPDVLGKLKQSVESVELDGHRLQVCGLLSEPAAVAVDYLYYMKHLAKNPITAEKYTILVYDLGHGTFDTAVVTAYSQGGKDCDLICQGGDDEVGGKKFDELLYRELAARIRKEAGENVSFNHESLRQLAIEMKHELSENPISDRDFALEEGEILLSITREEFEDLIGSQLLRTLEEVNRVMEETAQRKIKIDAIVLSGGSSYIPAIRKALQMMTDNSIPVDLYRPSVGVSYGASRAAHDLYQGEIKKSEVLAQHCERSCGISIDSDVHFMLNEDDALPCKSKPMSITTAPSGRSEIWLHRAKNRMPSQEKASLDDCQEIRRIVVELPPNQNCTIQLQMDKNRCIYLDCTLPDGKKITRSTFRSAQKEE